MIHSSVFSIKITHFTRCTYRLPDSLSGSRAEQLIVQDSYTQLKMPHMLQRPACIQELPVMLLEILTYLFSKFSYLDSQCTVPAWQKFVFFFQIFSSYSDCEQVLFNTLYLNIFEVLSQQSDSTDYALDTYTYESRISYHLLTHG